MSISSTAQQKPRRNVFQWIGSHWFQTFLIIYGAWVFLPYLAPVFMQIGWTGAGQALYFMYSFFCHQLPERSFFWFGEKSMYSLGEIQAAWQDTANPLILRQFIGNEAMGWKIAWSDRMISFYTSVWFFALLWYPMRRRVKPLSWLAFVLMLIPIAMDGMTHMVSDFAGIGQGFRDTNQWLAVLTNNTLPVTFYAGDALGSFNSIMRFITGLLAGLAVVWLAFPYIVQSQDYNQQLVEKSYAKVIEQIKNENPHSAG
ncbi:MAG: hypothetical protein DCC56_01520 [Anaerolineae bacterium]|nr:MAG: hypothetical protein DCC56_01520 [Anaerolineae bacterium]WKZ44717.1 MAG: DUF2085 domain-containing protein [Anaerolineales bacterium]